MPQPTEQRRASRRGWGLDDGKALTADRTDFVHCRQLVDRYVVRHRNYYRRRATLVRRNFRVAGVAAILGGAALPVVAAVNGAQVQLIITIVTVVVAALTALRSFFQWDVQWRVLRQADWELTYLLAIWEAELERLAACEEEKERECGAVKATRRVLKAAERVVSREATSFFRGLGWPHPDNDQSRPPVADLVDPPDEDDEPK